MISTLILSQEKIWTKLKKKCDTNVSALRGAQRAKGERQEIESGGDQGLRAPVQPKAAGHKGGAAAGGRVEEELRAHAVGHALVPERRKAGKDAVQRGCAQRAARMEDAALSVLQGVHFTKGGGGKRWVVGAPAQKAQERSSPVAVRKHAAGAGEDVPLRIEGRRRPDGQARRVVAQAGRQHFLPVLA